MELQEETLMGHWRVFYSVEATLADNEAADEQKEQGSHKTAIPGMPVSIRYRRFKNGQ